MPTMHQLRNCRIPASMTPITLSYLIFEHATVHYRFSLRFVAMSVTSVHSKADMKVLHQNIIMTSSPSCANRPLACTRNRKPKNYSKHVKKVGYFHLRSNPSCVYISSGLYFNNRQIFISPILINYQNESKPTPSFLN
jgi:hypothetical protein